jgi:hypothetical protein
MNVNRLGAGVLGAALVVTVAVPSALAVARDERVASPSTIAAVLVVSVVSFTSNARYR